MPIEMPKGLPFSVDMWTPQSRLKRHHFLTHAHSDHLSAIAAHSSYPIYATSITKSIALRYSPQLEKSLFVEIEVGGSVVVNDPDGDFTVLAFDANHCPGAVMFLFEGEFGNILHTGDCRLTPDCLHCLPLEYITKKRKDNLRQLDYLFLDCTFGRSSVKMPSKQSAIQQVINCIWKHPDSPVVYLACDMLGQEEILVHVSRTFGSKIYVDKLKYPECFHALSLAAPEVLSQDSMSHFQVIGGFPKLNERVSQKLAEARANLQAEPLFIRPSAQWFAGNDQSQMTQVDKPAGLSEAVRDEFGIWHVCYSMHSSREELEWALQLLRPKWVISTTPPCRAMELDYVKKNCYKTNITSDDPLWKLLKAATWKSTALPRTTEDLSEVTICSVLEASAVSVAANEFQLEEVSLNHYTDPKSDLSRLSSRTFTLFGRARQGLLDTDLLLERKSDPINVGSETDEDETQVVCFPKATAVGHESAQREGTTTGSCTGELVKDTDVKIDDCAVPSQCLDNAAELYTGKSVEEVYVDKVIHCAESTRTFRFTHADESLEVLNAERDTIRIRSLRNYDSSLKKLYRSMNAPIPRPLPSLTELLGASKSRKLGPDFVPRRFDCADYFLT